MTNHFSVKEFVSKEDPGDAWNYIVECGLCEPNAQIGEEELRLLHNSLDEFDEVHLAYALVVAEHFAAHRFAYDAARLLSHPSLSVRVNAYRVIRAVPAGLLCEGIKKAVAAGLSRCPEKAFFDDALVR